jgi:ATP-dependent RNA helicase DDX19/DBP5
MSAPPAAGSSSSAPKAKWGDEPDVSDQISAVTQQLAEAEPTEVEVDEPEQLTGLDEKADDEVIDGTAQTDALHAVTVDRFDSEKLALDPLLLKGLAEMNFVRPSRIQAISLPKIWHGRNLLAQSHNGTGKTACFVLGMLRMVEPTPKPQAICLCPTRELAKQLSGETAKMGKYLLEAKGMQVKTILRDERFEKGARLSEQIIIGTPGKIWSLMGLRVLETNAIKVFVLDEADEMLQSGSSLADCTKKIRSKMPKKVQTLFFSATWTDSVVKFAKTLGGMSADEWQQVTVKRQYIFNDQVKQRYIMCAGRKDKESRLGDMLTQVQVGQCICFVHTREAVDTLSALLTANGHTVSSLHGRMDEKNRDKVLADFHAGISRILITTNVLSRGIDVPAVTLVIQYDMPVMRGGVADPETYLHRVGRTGRFGRKGVALNMIENPKELGVLKKIEEYYQRVNLVEAIPDNIDPEEFEKLLVPS